MDANERLHIEWVGMAQPEGLVVTPATLKAAEANITWPITELQEALRELAGKAKAVLDLPRFFRDILGWSDEFIVTRDGLPPSLRVTVEGSEPLVPAYAVKSADEENVFVLLVGQAETTGTDLDAASDDQRWTASPQQRFERLLRETGVHIGVLTNGKVFRLVYAPKGETAGWVTFRLNEMLTVDGRPLLGALHMLLNERRLLSLEPERRLAGLLKASREYQNTVSTALREQVLSALRELLVGFQHADRLDDGAILGEYRRGHLDEVYKGLVTVLMRSVFVLFAEEQNLLPLDRELYASSYSLTRLYAQLVEDHDRYGDTIEDRYGAWARIIALFRLLHDGVRAADGLFIPARKGDFFSPNAFPFLEGRPRGSNRQVDEILELPRISDGVVFRVLSKLLVLDGERLQYKGLDVEQVGCVYEGLMGFEVEVAAGDSLAVMPDHVVVNLEELLKLSGPERLKQLKTLANLELTDKAAAEVKAAATIAALEAALGRRVSARQPGLLARGGLYLQPGEERRKTGSHYTPKSLTSPIVETTLRPVFERLGSEVTPEQILDLCICDPAMGSGAFLVEACRQLADHLAGAWRRTGKLPTLPPDEDLVLHARRLIAQQCLYGVDKNPLAVDLARLSLWLVTFAREHPFTFVDHSLRCGDSLVGLSREQIASLTLDVTKGHQVDTVRQVVNPAVKKAEELRNEIHAIGDPPDNERLVQLWEDANDALDTVRILGDLIIVAFFSADSDKARKKALEELANKVPAWLSTGQYEAELRGLVADFRQGKKPLTPFHWEIEFPEVFGRENPGFDCFVGNPPFLGGRKISGTLGDDYLAWLTSAYVGAGGQADLVSYFFRRTFDCSRLTGTVGLIATNTIAQGDTRRASLQHLCREGATIFNAKKRLLWPNTDAAAVVVSVVHFAKGVLPPPFSLDDQPRGFISAYLFYTGTNEDPCHLHASSGLAFKGQEPYGRAFIFDDAMKGANGLAEMKALVKKDPRNADRIRPYLGGDEFLRHPAHVATSFVIDFGSCSESDAQKWPDLYAICEERVRAERADKAPEVAAWPFWKFWRTRQDLRTATERLSRMLMHPFTSTHLAFSFVPSMTIVASPHIVVADDGEATFAVLQSRVHEGWAWFFASSMKDDLRYTPSDCFETFPFPAGYKTKATLKAIGQQYYDFRAALMLKRNEGLTKTYNRFHSPDENRPEILELRSLHAQMDRAVLDAYGWTDIYPTYDFREQINEHIRLSWDEETRDEVLARLLELNRVMAAQEEAEVPAPTGHKKPKKAVTIDNATLDLFGGKTK